MTEHEWAQEQLTASFVGELPTDEAERLASHLRDCQECTTVLADATRLDRELATLFTDVRPGRIGAAELMARPARIELTTPAFGALPGPLKASWGSTPFPRTVELRLKTPDPAAPLYDASAGYGTARGSRKDPLVPRRASDIGDGALAPA